MQNGVVYAIAAADQLVKIEIGNFGAIAIQFDGSEAAARIGSAGLEHGIGHGRQAADRECAGIVGEAGDVDADPAQAADADTDVIAAILPPDCRRYAFLKVAVANTGKIDRADPRQEDPAIGVDLALDAALD